MAIIEFKVVRSNLRQDEREFSAFVRVVIIMASIDKDVLFFGMPMKVTIQSDLISALELDDKISHVMNSWM
jgi:hypothetical protein